MNNCFFLAVISLDVKSWNQTVTALCLKLSVIVGNQSGKITISKNHYLQTRIAAAQSTNCPCSL